MLLCVKLDLALQVVTVVLKFFAAVFVDLNLVLKGGNDQLGILLEVLQLLKDIGTALLGQSPKVIINAHVFHPRKEFAQLLLRWALKHHPVDQCQYLDTKLEVRD